MDAIVKQVAKRMGLGLAAAVTAMTVVASSANGSVIIY